MISLGVVTVLYMMVTSALTLMVPYTEVSESTLLSLCVCVCVYVCVCVCLCVYVCPEKSVPKATMISL